MPGAEPFHYPGDGQTGVLLVHGFTGSPFEMRPLGRHLADLGIGSVGVLLRGHGTHPSDMLGHRYEDWIADAEAGLDELLATKSRVFIVGMSMGGTIALNLAARRAGDPRLAGVVTLCAPVRLVDWRLGLVRVLGRAIRWQAWGKPDIKDSSAWAGHVGYRRFRTGTVIEVVGLLRETKALLARVQQPVLIVHARDDHTVLPMNAELIFNAVGSADKRLLWLENSYHVVTVDYDAPMLNAEISRFIADRAGGTEPPVGLAASISRSM